MTKELISVLSRNKSSEQWVRWLPRGIFLACTRTDPRLRKKKENSLSTRAGFNWTRESGMMCKCSAPAARWCMKVLFCFKMSWLCWFFVRMNDIFTAFGYIKTVKYWLSLLRMCFVFHLAERRSYRDGTKNKTKSTTCWRSSCMHRRTYSQIYIRIFYLASHRLYQVSKRTEINAQGSLLCGVSFLVAGRWSGSSVADVRYRIGVDVFSGGLYAGNNGQAYIGKSW